MTIKFTVDFFDPRGPGRLVKDGNDIFGFLTENKMAYSCDEGGPLGEFADFTITVENYFQFQALGDFLYK
jgi:hypothetical protein